MTIIEISRFSATLRAAALFGTFLLSGCATDGRVQSTSENFNSRVGIVVIHHTTADFADSLQILTKTSGNPVSSHYLIPEPNDPSYTGKKLEVYELVPETERAWHAGSSFWGGRIALNDQSIGIELVNQTYCKSSPSDLAAEIEAPARICFYPDFAEAQLVLLIDLLEDILERHPNVRPTNFVGHADIAPGRKIDPGPRFPWERLYQLGFGAWFDDDTVLRYWDQFRNEPLPLQNVQQALSAYGYGIEVTGELDKHTRNVLRAFQMHFRPSQVSSEPTAETTAILFALIEKYYPEQLEDLLRVDAAEEDMTQPQVAPAGLPTDAA